MVTVNTSTTQRGMNMNMSLVMNSLPQLSLKTTYKIPLFLLLIESTFSLVSEIGAAILSMVKCLFLFEMLVSSRHPG